MYSYTLPTSEYPRQPWMKDVVKNNTIHNGMDFLNAEIDAFVQYIQPTDAEFRFREQVISDLGTYIQEAWPGSRVEIFGSCGTKLILPDSDIDVVVQSRFINTGSNISQLKQTMGHLAEYLYGKNFITRDWEAVTGAVVPIIKLTTTPPHGSFKIDISFNTDNGPRGLVKMKELLSEADKLGKKERVIKLVYLVKALTRSWNLHEVKHGGFGSLSLFLLVVSLIQMEDRELRLIQGDSSGADLVNFLHYYGNVYSPSMTISTADGGSIKLRSHYRFPPRHGPGANSRFSIQHPVDLNRDSASGSYKVDEFRAKLRSGAAKLSKYHQYNISGRLDKSHSALGEIGLAILSANGEETKRRAIR